MADGVLTLIIDCPVLQSLNVEDLHQVPPGSVLPGRMISSLGRGKCALPFASREKGQGSGRPRGYPVLRSLPILIRSCEVDTARQRSADIVNCKGYFLNLFNRDLTAVKKANGIHKCRKGREKIKGPNHGAFSRLPPN